MSAPIPGNEAQRLEALQRYRILDTAPERAYDDFALLASTLCQAPVAMVTFLDRDRAWNKCSFGLDATEAPREFAFCAHAVLRDEVMIVEDARRDPRFADNPHVAGDPGVRFYAGAPLIDRDGLALGALCVVDWQPRSLSPTQRTALQALARQLITALEFRRASATLAQALTDLKTLHGLLPICLHCKGIRDDAGYWQSVETYVSAHSEADFSHGICPACLREQYPELYEQMHAEGKI